MSTVFFSAFYCQFVVVPTVLTVFILHWPIWNYFRKISSRFHLLLNCSYFLVSLSCDIGLFWSPLFIHICISVHSLFTCKWYLLLFWEVKSNCFVSHKQRRLHRSACYVESLCDFFFLLHKVWIISKHFLHSSSDEMSLL